MAPPLPANTTINMYTFPSDLIADGRRYYVEIDLYDYTGFSRGSITEIDFSSFSTAFSTLAATTPILIPGANKSTGSKGNIKLPMPRRVNDALTLTWNEFNGTGRTLGAATSIANAGMGPAGARGFLSAVSATSSLAPFIGIASGYAINPLLFMQFQRPNFRTFKFDWLLAPKNQTESKIIKNIVSALKKAASPTYLGLVFGYPQVALVKFYPNDKRNGESDIGKHMILKPCVIRGVAVDYSPGGSPSFFKRTNAPTLISLSLDLVEIQLWFRNDEGL